MTFSPNRPVLLYSTFMTDQNHHVGKKHCMNHLSNCSKVISSHPQTAERCLSSSSQPTRGTLLPHQVLAAPDLHPPTNRPISSQQPSSRRTSGWSDRGHRCARTPHLGLCVETCHSVCAKCSRLFGTAMRKRSHEYLFPPLRPTRPLNPHTNSAGGGNWISVGLEDEAWPSPVNLKLFARSFYLPRC